MRKTRRKLEVGVTDLATTHPELVSQWDYERNGQLTPRDVLCGSGLEVYWKQNYVVPDDYPVEHLKGVEIVFTWKSPVRKRINANNEIVCCPYLAKLNAEVWTGYNDLSTMYPELAAQWDYEANKGLTDKDGNDISTPDKILAGSHKIVHWKLPYIVPDDYPVEHLRGELIEFTWSAMIKSRINDNNEIRQCPYLTGHDVWSGFNDLATLNPELAAQWDYEANKGLADKNGRDISTPDKITINSNQEVSWIIDVFDKDSGETFSYNWKATVCDRLKTRTPFYIGSKGEISVRNTLIDNRVKFKEQNTFPDRVGLSNRPLKDDFAIFDKSGSIIATIEFNGEHHYRPVDFAGKGQEWAKAQFEAIQKRDKIKSDYLRERNIKQLIVPYTEFEKVEEIVNNFIEELSKDFDLQHSKEDEKGKVWAPPKARINQKAVAEFTKEILTKYRNDPKPAIKQEKVWNSKRNDIAIDI